MTDDVEAIARSVVDAHKLRISQYEDAISETDRAAALCGANTLALIMMRHKDIPTFRTYLERNSHD